MRYRRFGRTGLRVSEISLGGLFFSPGLSGGRNVEATIQCAADCGINLIDIAPAYQGSEEEVGKVLAAGLRRKFLLATKWWPYMPDGKTIDQNPSVLHASVERSLQRLRTDVIDLFQFHSVTHRGDVDRLLGGPLLPEIAKLKKEGKTRFLGLSNSGEWDPNDERLQEAVRSGSFDACMPEFMIFRQRPVATLLPVCAKCDAGIISIMPLGQAAWGYGLRDRKYLRDSLDGLTKKGALPSAEPYTRDDILDFLLDEHTTTIPAAALRYCLSFPEISTVCCGTNDPAHVAANAAVSEAGPYDATRLARVRELFGRLGASADPA